MNRKSFTKMFRQKVLDKCNGRCAYCGCELTSKTMVIDHVIPVYLGDAYEKLGKDLNHIDNLLPACRSCNNYKDTMPLEIFRKQIERQPEILFKSRPTYRMAVRYGLVIPNPHPVKFYFEEIKEETK